MESNMKRRKVTKFIVKKIVVNWSMVIVSKLIYKEHPKKQLHQMFMVAHQKNVQKQKQDKMKKHNKQFTSFEQRCDKNQECK